MLYAHCSPRIFKAEESIKFPMHRIKHEIFIHRHETTLEEGESMPSPRCPQNLLRPSWVMRPLFKIGRLDPRGGLISALAVYKGFCAVRNWTGNTNPREKRVGISRDIRDSRGRSSWSIEEALVGIWVRNRLLRLARRSNFGPGCQLKVSVRSGNTNSRGEKFCRCWDISAVRQNTT